MKPKILKVITVVVHLLFSCASYQKDQREYAKINKVSTRTWIALYKVMSNFGYCFRIQSSYEGILNQGNIVYFNL